MLDDYLELSSKRTRPYIQVRLMDLSVAMKRTYLPLREAAFFLGVAQLTSREAAEYLNISHSLALKRFEHAIEELLIHLNGR